MWKKIKIVLISASILIVTVLIFIFRGNNNRPGVSDSDQLNRDINSGFRELQDGLEESSGAIDGVSGDLGQRIEEIDTLEGEISNTGTKLQSALDILRKAKEKNRNDLA